MSPLKPENASSAQDYIAQIDEPRRGEIEALDRLIREEAPALERQISFGMLGYGTYSYRYASGREGEAAVIALASQKAHISLYTRAYLAERYAGRLGEVNVGKSCVRFKRLADIDEGALRELVRESARHFAEDPDFARAG